MLASTDTLKDALNSGYLLRPSLQLIAEWNHNRFGGIQTVDNDPSDETSNDNLEEFPISSIVDPNRPPAGKIIKARAAYANVYALISPSTGGTWFHGRAITGEEAHAQESYSDKPADRRYYTVGADSLYKYWASPGISASAYVGGGYAFGAGEECRPFVIYKVASMTNKIVVGFENSWANPVDYDIQITVDGTNWTTIASDLPLDSNGRVILYRQSDNSWSSTVWRENPTRILGVKVIVNKINKPIAHLNLIEISARLERDLTPYLQSWNSSMTLSDQNFITPLGKSSANTAELTLFNDGTFSNENEDSLYYHIIDKNVAMTLDIIYDLQDYNGTTDRVRQFTMWVDDWGSQDNADAEVSLRDSAKFLQDKELPEMLLENITVGEAVWRIMDAVGMPNFQYSVSAEASSTLVPYMWTLENATVWDTFTKIAEGTQTAIYFDEYDVLQIKTRDSVFDPAAEENWQFEATTGGGKVADIVEVNDSFNFESNKVNVNYKNTHITDDNKGLPSMEVVWQPDGDFLLNASRLVRTMSDTATYFDITTSEAYLWPYTGIVSIEGELISYDAKQYLYQKSDGTINYTWVASLEEQNALDKQQSKLDTNYVNKFTGRFRVKERGYLWTSPRVHAVDIAGYSTWRTNQSGLYQTAVTKVISQQPQTGTLRMVTDSTYTGANYALCLRGSTLDASPRWYGTRIKVNGAATGTGRGAAGIVFNSHGNGVAYYAELVRTKLLEDTANSRKINHEVNFGIKTADGTFRRVGGTSIMLPSEGDWQWNNAITTTVPSQGVAKVIAADVWYDLEVEFTIDFYGNHQIIIFVDGIVQMRVLLTTGRVSPTGQYGVYQRGRQVTDFEYLYAIDNNVTQAGLDTPDDISSWDYIKGGFRSNQMGKEYTYSTRDATRRVGKKNVVYKQRYNQYFYDEFGPVVHEVREMDVKFSKRPCLHSQIYNTNDSKSVVVDYTPTPFGAKFMLANNARGPAILNGEEKINAEETLNQQIFIYGRTVVQDEVQVVTVENEDRVRRSGEEIVAFDSDYIQSKDAAQSLGDWITKHWADGTDNVTLSSFGNPLVTLGDLVTVDYPRMFMYRDTHRFFVTEVKRSWDNGLSTQFVLRRTS